MGKVENIVDMTGGFNLTALLDVLMDGQSVRVTATGRSMMPTFHPNRDTIVISPVNRDELKVGDVVFFNRGDAVCVHRIIAFDADRIVIRGDGNAHSALEYAGKRDIFGIITAGTMYGCIPFTTQDRLWNVNGRIVMKYHRYFAIWHRLTFAFRTYLFSSLSMIVLLLLSFLNFNSVTEDIPVTFLDKIAHVIMYAGLTFVFWTEWIYNHAKRNPRFRMGFFFCTIMPVLVGGIIEILQEWLVEYRGGDILDFCANCAGVFFATVVSVFFIQPFLRKRIRKK